MEKTKIKACIAELKTEIAVCCPDCRTIKQAGKYLSDFSEKPDIKIEFPLDFLEKRQKENPHLPLSECEYIWTGYEFCRRLVSFDGFVLHASAVMYKERAYLFSAPSGMGKSTHTSIWQRVFGKEAVIINDDKPAIRKIGDTIYALGTPWSGKSDINENIKAPIAGICFLSRGNVNKIEKIGGSLALYMILNQTMRLPFPEFMDKLLSLTDTVMSRIPVYRMECNTEDEAAKVAFECMSKGD